MELRRWLVREHSLATHLVQQNVLDRVPADRLAEHPDGCANPIVWLLWHLARAEDVAINVIVRDGEQLIGAYPELDGRIGAGLGDDDVAGVTASLDVGRVLAYWRDVRGSVRDWLKTLDVSKLDDRPDVASALRRADTGAPDWLYETWSAFTVGDLIALPAIGHQLLHLGEMQSVRGRLGIRGL